MNETIKTLLNRRSIRKFKPDQIKDEELNAVLEAGKYAPSGGNHQSALFVVVQNKYDIKKLTKMNAAVLGKENFDPYFGAPTIILVFADKHGVTPIEDASLALGNLFNAAFSLGLGSCWIHRTKEMFESEDGIALLKEWGIQGDYIGVGSCILGYPDCGLPNPAARKTNSVKIIK